MKYNKFKLLQYNEKMPTVLTSDRYNGIGIVVYTNGIERHVYNMNGERLGLLSNYKGIDFLKLSSTGNWFVYAGVYITKRMRFTTTLLNESDKFIVVDVLVFDGECVINMPVNVRTELYLPKIKYSLVDGTVEIYNHISGTLLKGIFKTL